MTATIHAERLDLVSMTSAFLRASLDGRLREAEKELPFSLPSDWPGEHASLLSLRLKQLEEDPALQPWLVRAMVARDTRTMVGHIGFHTAPAPDYLQLISPGAVEFGFTVWPAFRRRGYARESSVALMQWARQTHGVSTFIMSIRPDNLPSQALAAQLGFRRIGSHIDEIDGEEDILEYRPPDSRSG